jgi:hypothetical protein
VPPSGCLIEWLFVICETGICVPARERIVLSTLHINDSEMSFSYNLNSAEISEWILIS